MIFSVCAGIIVRRAAVDVTVRGATRMDVIRRAVVMRGGNPMQISQAVKGRWAAHEGESRRGREGTGSIGDGDDDRRPDPKRFPYA